MNRLVLPVVLVAALAACGAAPEGRWPSLAMRAGEVQPLVQRPAVAPVTPAAAAAGQARDDTDARLSSLERDISALTERFAVQRAAVERTAAGQAGGSTVNAAAQIEISRAERLVSQAGDLRDRLDALAGDVALRSVDGDDATAVMRRIGAAIARVEALRAQ